MTSKSPSYNLEMSSAILESKEMYLESLLLLSKDKECVRAKDLADYMEFSKASVSRALSNLESLGLVFRDKSNIISLTNEGKSIAESVYEKHLVISDFFECLGVSRQTAEKDACKLEHIISEETFLKIKDFIKSH